MKRLLVSGALAFGAAALLGWAAGRAGAADPVPPFGPLPTGPTPTVPTPAALTVAVGTPGAAAPAAATPKAPPALAAAAPAPPAPAAAGVPAQGQAVPLAPPPGAPVIVQPAPGFAPPPGCGPACCEPQCLKKVCVPERDTKKVEKRVYGEACEDFCLPKCPLCPKVHLHKHGDCDTCQGDGCQDGDCQADGTCAKCEHHVRERKYLVVKIKHEEECIPKCHVEYQVAEPKCKESHFPHRKAPCADGGCLPPSGDVSVVPVAPPPPMPPAEKMPGPKGK
ncbi:MAG TPA: hypothetical protein VKA46_26270 [Gemmataceae bacterium]|nr:hypothetical protein [Gemmataceae bacterium]